MRVCTRVRNVGEKVAKPVFPWSLCFIPNEKLRKQFAGHHPTNNVLDLLQNVGEVEKLYDIWAIKEPYPLADPSLLIQYHLSH